MRIQGNTPADVISQGKELINKYGNSYHGAFGTVKAVKGVVFVIDNPTDLTQAYPYWSKEEDEYYLNTFVRPDHNQTPEFLFNKDENSAIHQYRYNHRSSRQN